MENENNALPQAGFLSCTENSTKTVETDGKDRAALALTFGFCVLAVDTVLFAWTPGLGIFVLVCAWYALNIFCRGREWLRRGEGRFLLIVNLLLAATFALQSSSYFRLWNLGALAVLLPVHAMAAAGRAPWWRSTMLQERAELLVRGLFTHLNALMPALAGGKSGKSRRVWGGILGVGAAVLLIGILLPVLASADALFAAVTESFSDFFRLHLTDGLARVIMGLALTPFFFSLLHFLRWPDALPVKAEKVRTAGDALPGIIVLAALDALYLLFLAVQVTGIVGGDAYLQSRGLSYSDWARSGFFQMVGVTAVNLTAILLVRQFSAGGRGWHGVQVLGTVLVGESGLLLFSAGWRMSLYVGAYGLSFKRVMTYWGMGMMAIFLAAALIAVWKTDFRFCRVAFAAAVIGWVLISFVPVDTLVARDGVDRYLAGENSVDLYYLVNELSLDGARQARRLESAPAAVKEYRRNYDRSLNAALNSRESEAGAECASWESWNLSAYLLTRQ